METRVALIGIMVECTDEIDKLNNILHEYSGYIIGRMGIPYREKNLSIISVAIDAPEAVISTVSGKIGMLKGISSKVVYNSKK
ncbi:MAG: iron-only hydrogenase system regulator [Lachnospiraceae bacterium]|nr:iron-only hydrogenase system regulator [Lachnospiraceae bacterium]